MKTKTHQITKSGSAYASKWCKSDCNDKFDKCVSDNSDDRDAIHKCFKMGNICLSKCKSEVASDYAPYSSASCERKCSDRYMDDTQEFRDCINDCTPRYYELYHSEYRLSRVECMDQCIKDGGNDSVCDMTCS